MLQRVLTVIGVVVGVVIGSMLWFWLLFGGWRVVCGDAVQPLFLAGSTQFGALAGVWGLLIAGLLVSRALRPLHFALWSFSLGSLYETLHYASRKWMAGIDLAITALVAIVFMQALTLAALYLIGVKPRQFLKALGCWAMLSASGVLGILLTNLWLMGIPCDLGVDMFDPLTGVAFSSLFWYTLFGLAPALITVLLFHRIEPQQRPR